MPAVRRYAAADALPACPYILDQIAGDWWP
jgi:hypothetical protein